MDIENYKKILLKKKGQILRTLHSEKRDEERIGEVWNEPKDIEDWAVISLTEDIKARLADRELSFLLQIEDALRRIKEGLYGICEVCGKKIQKQRLDILPWTKLCAVCSTKIDR